MMDFDAVRALLRGARSPRHPRQQCRHDDARRAFDDGRARDFDTAYRERRHRRLRSGARRAPRACPRRDGQRRRQRRQHRHHVCARSAPDPKLYSEPGKMSPPHYGAAKAALVQLTRHLAAEFGPRHPRQRARPGPFPQARGGARRPRLRGAARRPHHAGPHRPSARDRRPRSVPGEPGLEFCHRGGTGGGRRMDGLVRWTLGIAHRRSIWLSSRPSAATPIRISPKSLRQRLKSFTILDDVGDAGAAAAARRSRLVRLAGRHPASARRRERPRRVPGSYRLARRVRATTRTATRRLVATICPPAKRWARCRCSPANSHSATLVALRDTELLRLGPKAFDDAADALSARDAEPAEDRRAAPARRPRAAAIRSSRPKTFAVVPLQRGSRRRPAGARAASPTILVKHGRQGGGARFDRRADEPTDWFNRFEAEHDVVFYQGDQPDSTWTQFLPAPGRPRAPDRATPTKGCRCIRSSGAISSGEMLRPPELLLVHKAGCRARGMPRAYRAAARSVRHASSSCASATPATSSGWRASSPVRAVNIVLAGGGARGFAHIGVLKALKEAGVPFDYVGGTSMGGIIAAGVAMEWGIDEVTARVRDAFVDNNPLSDFTLPLIALFRGRKVSAAAAQAFRRHRASRIWPSHSSAFPPISPRDAITCIVRALVAGAARQRWRCPESCRRSPQDGGHLLVDGGVMNNLPVDVIAPEARGPIIAVDVSGEIDLRAADPRYGERSIWSLMWRPHARHALDHLHSDPRRHGGSRSQRRSRARAGRFPVRAAARRHRHERLEGLRPRHRARLCPHAMLEIEKHGLPLSDAFTAGPALAIKHAAE